MFPELKVKVLSLGAESKIIRREELRHTKRPLTQSRLRGHRALVVRPEARHSLLAYGFLRGRPYKSIEHICTKEPDWERVYCIAKRFKFYGAGVLYSDQHSVDLRTDFNNWRAEK